MDDILDSSIGQWCALNGVKTEWVHVWANSVRFAIYAVKSKQTYQTSKTITCDVRGD